MAELNEADRQEVSDAMETKLSNDRDPAAFGRQHLRAAVSAMDVWMNANASDINGALPQPFKGAASTSQKAMLLTMVAAKRYGTEVV